MVASIELVLLQTLFFLNCWFARTLLFLIRTRLLRDNFAHFSRAVNGSVWAAGRAFLFLSSLGLIDAIPLFTRHVWFLEHVDPLVGLEIVRCHVVQFMCDLVNASENYHVVFVNAGTVSTSGGYCSRVHNEVDL